jgi:glycerol uptake facilitator-like aquaporin
MFSRSKIGVIVAEILGTAVLTAVILAVSRSPIGLSYFVAIGAGLTLATLVLTVGPASGAHVNPAVTLSLWAQRQIDTLSGIIYIASQFLGAVLAWRLYMYLMDAPLKSIAGKFDWRVFVAEAVGTFIFTFGIAAAISQGYEGGKKAAVIGLSLLLGVMVAGTASNGLLNPAVAVGVQSVNTAYITGPIVGGLVGMSLYTLLFAPASTLPAKAKTKAKATTRRTATRRKKR